MFSAVGLLSLGIILIAIGLGCLFAVWLWPRRTPVVPSDDSSPSEPLAAQEKKEPPLGEPITLLADPTALPKTALDDEDDEDDEDVYVALEEDYAQRLEKHVTPPQETVEQSQSSEEEGYEFMTKDDAVRVQLDLARAYLEMGDYGAVQETLELVFNEGSEAERHEADLLLEQAKLAAED